MTYFSIKGLDSLVQRFTQEKELRAIIEEVKIPEPLNVKYLIYMAVYGGKDMTNRGSSLFILARLFKAQDTLWNKISPLPENFIDFIPEVRYFAKTFGVSTQTAWYWLDYWGTKYPKIKNGLLERNYPDMMTEHEQVQEKIGQLRANLLADTPQLPIILQQIKVYLSKNEEVVTLLTEEEIGDIIRAAQAVSREKIVDSLMKKGGKKLKDTELEDLM